MPDPANTEHTDVINLIKATISPYSSVVGSGVMLTNEKGHMIGQIAFLCHTDALRGKDVQVWLAKTIMDAINGKAAA